MSRLATLYADNFGDVLEWWVLEVLIVVFVALVADLLTRMLMVRLERRTQMTHTLWDDAIVLSIRRPLSALIWIVGIGFALDIARVNTGAAIFNAVDFLRELAVIATFAWFLMLAIRNGQTAYLEGQGLAAPADRATVDAIAKLLRITVAITAVLVAMQTMGYSISGLLAFGGIGGIAVGFAARDLLANFFGSIMIFLDRPFAVGEWIRSPDKDIEGIVEHISWRQTRIRRFDKRPLYVPNSTFSSIAVENPSRMTHRRIYETIGIRYEDAPKMQAIVADVKAMLLAHPELDTTQTTMVNFDKFAPSSLDFIVYCYTRTTDLAQFQEIKQDVLLKMMAVVAAHGAEVAFPTSTVHLGSTVQVKTGREKPEE